MTKISLLITTIILLLTCIQCTKSDLLGTDVQHQFFLESDNALIPVRVNGNTASKVFLIVVHGGPGGTGYIYDNLESFSDVESEYGVVYYDQRCAGNSQGNCNVESLDIDSHVDDLDKLIELIRFRYGSDSKIIALGHSWGGTLTLSYLADKQLQEKLSAAIIVGGPHAFANYALWVKDMVSFYADQQIGFNNNTEQWESLETEVNMGSGPTVDNITRNNQAAQQAQNLMSDSISSSDISINDFIGNIFGFDGTSVIISNTNANASSIMWDELANYNLDADLANITLPVALYWGRYDFVVPPIFGDTIYSQLGSTEKEFIYFDNSDHSPMLTEKVRFNATVLDFIDRYK